MKGSGEKWDWELLQGQHGLRGITAQASVVLPNLRNLILYTNSILAPLRGAPMWGMNLTYITSPLYHNFLLKEKNIFIYLYILPPIKQVNYKLKCLHNTEIFERPPKKRQICKIWLNEAFDFSLFFFFYPTPDFSLFYTMKYAPWQITLLKGTGEKDKRVSIPSLFSQLSWDYWWEIQGCNRHAVLQSDSKSKCNRTGFSPAGFNGLKKKK